MQHKHYASSHEALSFDFKQTVERFFVEEVTLYPEESIAFECNCSKERTSSALVSLGQDEVYEILAEQNIIDINCQFCNEQYSYQKSDIDELFGNKMLH